jgi:PAS domain-containing protein
MIPGSVAGLFAGPGEMRTRCRVHDWAATPLGPVDTWPPRLRTAVEITVGAASAMLLLWGPKQVMLYNDAYITIAGTTHPDALGRPLREVWPEAWAGGTTPYARVWAGETVTTTDVPCLRYRSGPAAPPEDAYCTFAVAPIRDEQGAVESMVVTAVETTLEVETRRLRAERERLLAVQNEREMRLRVLLDSLEDAVAVVEVLFDADAQAIDYRFLEANAAFGQHTGLAEVVGRTASELVPAPEAHWIEAYGQVATTGQPQRVRAASDAMGRRVEVYAFRIGQPEERRVALRLARASATPITE